MQLGIHQNGFSAEREVAHYTANQNWSLNMCIFTYILNTEHSVFIVCMLKSQFQNGIIYS